VAIFPIDAATATAPVLPPSKLSNYAKTGDAALQGSSLTALTWVYLFPGPPARAHAPYSTHGGSPTNSPWPAPHDGLLLGVPDGPPAGESHLLVSLSTVTTSLTRPLRTSPLLPYSPCLAPDFVPNFDVGGKSIARRKEPRSRSLHLRLRHPLPLHPPKPLPADIAFLERGDLVPRPTSPSTKPISPPERLSSASIPLASSIGPRRMAHRHAYGVRHLSPVVAESRIPHAHFNSLRPHLRRNRRHNYGDADATSPSVPPNSASSLHHQTQRASPASAPHGAIPSPKSLSTSPTLPSSASTISPINTLKACKGKPKNRATHCLRPARSGQTTACQVARKQPPLIRFSPMIGWTLLSITL